MDIQTLKEGDVLTYDARLTSGDDHCREGIAVVRDEDGELVARDTFWDAFWGSGGRQLSVEELETAEFKFHNQDYDIVGSRREWEKYHPDQRQVLSKQHRLRMLYLVRKGAKKDLATQIQNAREAVAEAARGVESAKASLEWRKRDLELLLEEDGA